MQHCSALQPFLTAVAQTFQVEAPVFDESGFASLFLDDQVCVHFQVRDQTRELTLFVLLGEVPTAFQSEILHYALCANLKQTATRGAVLALEADSTTMVLHQMLPIDRLSVDTLSEQLHAMQRVSQTWHRILAGDPVDTASLPASVSPYQVALPLHGDLYCPMLLA